MLKYKISISVDSLGCHIQNVYYYKIHLSNML